MPGFVIHTAIAQEYLRKNNLNYNKDFIRGNLLPDFTSNKAETHYGKTPAFTSLKEFLKYNKIHNNINKGKFLHLISDYLFYNYYLDTYTKEILHNDYDTINKILIEKYNVKLLDEVKEKVFFIDEKPKILNFNLACKVIDEISDLNIFEVEKEVKENNKKWFYYKKIDI